MVSSRLLAPLPLALDRCCAERSGIGVTAGRTTIWRLKTVRVELSDGFKTAKQTKDQGRGAGAARATNQDEMPPNLARQMALVEAR
jgi:hypothetical protein